MTHALARGTTYQHDEAGNIPRIVDPLGGVTTQTFDALGRLASRSLRNSITSTFTVSGSTAGDYDYDSAGRVVGPGIDLEIITEALDSSASTTWGNVSTGLIAGSSDRAMDAADAFLGGAWDCSR